MTTTLLKQQITEAVNDISDKGFLEAVFKIVSNKAEETPFELTVAMKNELDKRKQNDLEGNSKSYSWQDVKKAALKK